MEAELREVSCSPTLSGGHCLNPVITSPRPKADRVNALQGEQGEAGPTAMPWGSVLPVLAEGLGPEVSELPP